MVFDIVWEMIYSPEPQGHSCKESILLEPEKKKKEGKDSIWLQSLLNSKSSSIFPRHKHISFYHFGTYTEYYNMLMLGKQLIRSVWKVKV